jgi:hypothetical protein
VKRTGEIAAAENLNPIVQRIERVTARRQSAGGAALPSERSLQLDPYQSLSLLCPIIIRRAKLSLSNWRASANWTSPTARLQLTRANIAAHSHSDETLSECKGSRASFFFCQTQHLEIALWLRRTLLLTTQQEMADVADLSIWFAHPCGESELTSANRPRVQ